MKLSEAEIKIQRLANIPFKDYLNPDVFKDAMLKLNKGKTGQLLEPYHWPAVIQYNSRF